MRSALTAVAVLALLVLARVWLASVVPLTDTTEARYGEMSRKMVETSDWITPQHDYGVPFWGKPPLAMWTSAGGIELLGADELGPRLPILVLSVAFLALFFAWLEPQIGLGGAAFGTVVLASSLLFYISMAAVMTDMLLTVSVGAALMAFWARCRGGGRLWEIVLYMALGLGLLAKGPLAGVLTFGPIVLWSVVLRRVKFVWHRFAWLKGLVLVAAVALPWYLLAELKTPGFLKYFIVGEHLSRFLVPDWQGDLYGFAHEEPFGTIWAFFALGLLPWSVLLLPVPFTRRKALSANWSEHRELIVFGACWALVPLLLFTPAANIIAPYALPALPGAVAAFMAAYARPAADRTFERLAWVGTACVLIPGVWLATRAEEPEFMTPYTQKYVVATIERTHPAGCAIRYWQDRYFSAEYYSEGAARRVEDSTALERTLDDGQRVCLVVAEGRLSTLPEGIKQRMHAAERLGEFTVLESRPRARAPQSATGIDSSALNDRH